METKSDSTSLRLVPAVGRARARKTDETKYSQLRPPTHLGRYVVLQEIGRGGMGVVWTAYDPKLDRKVAIKLLKGSARTSIRRARFIREAQVLARLSHPNIVTVYDVDIHEGQLYMAMEYIDGHTLERWLRVNQDWQEILDVFRQAGEGLAGAHAAGITHRDFKPSNVLIATDGRVKVLDFGLAKSMDRGSRDDAGEGRPVLGGSMGLGDMAKQGQDPKLMEEAIGSTTHGRLTKVGRIVGTPAYMAPEQYVPLSEHGVSGWSDQFGFAVALYEALYGELPFEGEDLYETCENVREGRIREPGRESSVPGWVFRVLQRALRYSPEDRYASMQDLLASLRADTSRRRRRLLVFATGLGIAGLGALGVTRAMMGNTPSTTDEAPRPCQGADVHMTAVWDAQARAAVEHGLVVTGRPFAYETSQRVVEGLDRYAEAWVEQHTAICEATRIHGEQSEALLDVRMKCLDRRQSELGSLIKVLATAEDDTVEVAVAAVGALRSSASCLTARPGFEQEVPVDPVRRGEFLSLRMMVDDARALLTAGRSLEARDKAAAAGQGAKQAGLRNLLAEALVAEGKAHRELRDSELAQRRLREGIAIASRSGSVYTEAAGWIELVYVAGVLLSDLEQAEQWRFVAENALHRASTPRDLESSLALNVSAVLLAHGRLDEAARFGERTLDRVARAEGQGSLLYAKTLNNLGIVAAKRAEWALAEGRLRKSYEIKRALLGARHPEVISNLMNLANALVQYAKTIESTDRAEARFDEAERLYADVVSVREQEEGPRSKNTVRALANLGQLQRRRGKLAHARMNLEQALRSMRKTPEATEDLAVTLRILAQVEQEAGHHQAAEQCLDETLSLQLEHYGDLHASVGTTRLQRCDLFMEMDDAPRARSECEQAIEIFKDDSPSRNADSLRKARSKLAGVLDALGRTQAAARQRKLALPPPSPSEGP